VLREVLEVRFQINAPVWDKRRESLSILGLAALKSALRLDDSKSMSHRSGALKPFIV